ncbi:hypothetical protein GEMRC1_011923 [Eukaryota sp. GEM-RC1]
MLSFFSKFVSASTGFPYKILSNYYDSNSFWSLHNSTNTSTKLSFSAILLDAKSLPTSFPPLADATKSMIKYRHPFVLSVNDVSHSRDNSSCTIIAPCFLPLSSFLSSSTLPSSCPYYEVFTTLKDAFSTSFRVFDLFVCQLFEALCFCHSNGLSVFGSCTSGRMASTLIAVSMSGEMFLNPVNFQKLITCRVLEWMV